MPDPDKPAAKTVVLSTMPLNTQAGVPHKGWTIADVIDLQIDADCSFGDYEDCEFCGQEQIRYVHILQHSVYPDQIRVGCVCAEHLTNDYVNPRRHEAKLRSRAAKRSRWTQRAWKVSAKGNLYLKTRDDHHVVVFPAQRGYMLVIDGRRGRKVYPETGAAQLAAFDYLYLKRK